MYKLLKATCKDGNLILSEKLGTEMEGKNLQIIILDTDELEVKKEQFFRFVDTQSFSLSTDYKFNRDELHDR